MTTSDFDRVLAELREYMCRAIEYRAAFPTLCDILTRLLATEPPRAMTDAVPLAIRLPCPDCRRLHIDTGAFATKVHYTHACQYCGHVWRPAIAPTVGVRFLPGFKGEEETE